MPEVPITGLYLALFALFSAGVAFPAGKLRGSTGISVGDGGNPDLTVAMRRHANFVEYVPLFLIMLLALELNGTGKALLHGLGIAMLVVRTCHAAGLRKDEITALRGIGAGGTLLLTVIAAGVLGWQFVQA